MATLKITGAISAVVLLPIVIAVLRHYYPIPPLSQGIDPVVALKKGRKLFFFKGYLALAMCFVILAGVYIFALPPLNDSINLVETTRVRIAPHASVWLGSLCPFALVLSDWMSGIAMRAAISVDKMHMLRHAESVSSGCDATKSRIIMWPLMCLLGLIMFVSVATSSIHADPNGITIREPLSVQAILYGYDELDYTTTLAGDALSSISTDEIKFADGRTIRFGIGAWDESNRTRHGLQRLIELNKPTYVPKKVSTK